MTKQEFDKLMGIKISVLIDNVAPSGKRESYVGELKESGKDFICLILSQDYKQKHPIRAVFIKHSLILSVWVYE